MRIKRFVSIAATLFCDQKLSRSYTKMSLIKDLKEWKFSVPSYSELPIDEYPAYDEPRAVKDAVFSKVPVEPLTGNLHLVCSSEDALQLLDLDPALTDTQLFVDFVAGRYLPENGLTVCHRYGGYQFGYWADQLGDGRAHILGEYVNSKGCSWQPQLKGSGSTPYSRFGDGRAVLRSSVREMVASEACHWLGIPTTRAAALVVSDDHKVWRDVTYSGRARQEKAAIVMRLAPAWYRLGSLEIMLKRREPHTMDTLLQFIVKHHFPEIDPSDEDKYVKLFSEIAHRNLDMVATWQGFGFSHGVLNTDNISMLGLTIDYGPYGFLDHYSEHYVPNSSDDLGRYAFNKQPDIIIWNLQKFSEALQPMLTEDQKEKVKSILGTLKEYVDNKILKTYLLKLGLKEIQDGDGSLVSELLDLMQLTSADFTATFRQLTEVDSKDLFDKSLLETKWSLKKLAEAPRDKWGQWVARYRDRLVKESVEECERRARMSAVNPVYVPRNWMLQEAIADADNNDFQKVRFLLRVLRHPFTVDPEAEARGYSAEPPSWAYGLKLSCSS